MVRLKRKRKKESITSTFLRWMERTGTEEEEQVKVVRASQRVLLDALVGVVGEAKSLTYQFEHGTLVRLISGENDGITVEWNVGTEGVQAEAQNSTELYEVCFPTQKNAESEFQYQVRVLEGLDRFVDSIAVATLVSRESSAD